MAGRAHEPTCGTCRHFDASGERCRRYPPREVGDDLLIHIAQLLELLVWLSGKEGRSLFEDDSRGPGQGRVIVEATEHCNDFQRWPYTDAGDWCGEYKPLAVA